jgi:hypothetical protein
MGWFSKKPSWEIKYAENIYDGLVAHNDFGDMTALMLRIPTAAHNAYQNTILLQRAMICFVALMEMANPRDPIAACHACVMRAKAPDRTRNEIGAGLGLTARMTS